MSDVTNQDDDTHIFKLQGKLFRKHSCIYEHYWIMEGNHLTHSQWKISKFWSWRKPEALLPDVEILLENVGKCAAELFASCSDWPRGFEELQGLVCSC